MEEGFLAVFGMATSMVVPFAVIGLLFWFVYSRRRKAEERWRDFAHQAGLVVTPGNFFTHPTVGGVYGGFNVDLRTVARSSGQNSTTYTVMTVALPIGNRLMLQFYKEGVLSKIGKALGTQDVQVGDPRFDQAFMIKSNAPEYVSGLLTPEVRELALYMPDAMNVKLAMGHVSWEQLGTLTDASRLGNVLNMLVIIARQVLSIEAPQMLHQAPPRQAHAASPGVIAEAAPKTSGLKTHLLKMSKCPNCGGKLEWAPEKTTDVVQCGYCGVSTKIKLL